MLHRIRQPHTSTGSAIAVDETRLIDSSIEQFLAALRPVGGEHREANVHL